MPRNFTDDEVEGLQPALVEKLDLTRDVAGVPFVITSGKRVSGPNKPKSHDRGNAVDLACTTSYRRMRIVRAALSFDAHCGNCGSRNIRGETFRRIGVYDRHIHLDIDTKSPLDVMWWGESK